MILVIALLSSVLIASVSTKKCGDSQLLGDYCDKCLRYVSPGVTSHTPYKINPFEFRYMYVKLRACRKPTYMYDVQTATVNPF